ncbi:MAG: Cys-tRNA(Pro) deacylase, partial [Clostridia bacterium]|nr:Cys-tRNA(Pro) deacylase [Clostridia bacterium]
VAAELNLKKAAKAVGEKSVDMIKQKELLPLTGYVHGGCSPIGMKKCFMTTMHESVSEYETICFSAGKIGFQVELNPKELEKVIRYQTADIID